MHHLSGSSELKWAVEVLLDIVAWINISGLLASCLKNPGDTDRRVARKPHSETIQYTVSSGLHDCRAGQCSVSAASFQGFEEQQS